MSSHKEEQEDEKWSVGQYPNSEPFILRHKTNERFRDLPMKLEGTLIGFEFMKKKVQFLETQLMLLKEQTDLQKRVAASKGVKFRFDRLKKLSAPPKPHQRKVPRRERRKRPKTVEEVAERNNDTEKLKTFLYNLPKEMLPSQSPRKEDKPSAQKVISENVNTNNKSPQIEEEEEGEDVEESEEEKQANEIIRKLCLLEILPETRFNQEQDWKDHCLIRNELLSLRLPDLHPNPIEFNDIKKSLQYICSGSFGSVFSFRLPVPLVPFSLQKVERILISKFLQKDISKNVDPMLLFSRDCPPLGYHKNISDVVYFDTKMKLNLPERLVLQRLRLQKDKKLSKAHVPHFENGIIVMKTYPWDLKTYLLLRKYKKQPLSILEICYIVKGILEGVKFLNDNFIVHRDLHLGNIFLEINDQFCRIIVGDFGCSIDFKRRTVVVLDEEGRKKMTVSSTDSDADDLFVEYPGTFPDFNLRGGLDDSSFDNWVAPEIRDVEMKIGSGEDWSLDFSKSDLWTIGVITNCLLEHRKSLEEQRKKMEIERSSVLEKNAEVKRVQEEKKREEEQSKEKLEESKRREELERQEKQEERFCEDQLEILVQRMLENTSNRIDFSDALKIIDEIVRRYAPLPPPEAPPITVSEMELFRTLYLPPFDAPPLPASDDLLFLTPLAAATGVTQVGKFGAKNVISGGTLSELSKNLVKQCPYVTEEVLKTAKWTTFFSEEVGSRVTRMTLENGKQLDFFVDMGENWFWPSKWVIAESADSTLGIGLSSGLSTLDIRMLMESIFSGVRIYRNRKIEDKKERSFQNMKTLASGGGSVFGSDVGSVVGTCAIPVPILSGIFGSVLGMITGLLYTGNKVVKKMNPEQARLSKAKKYGKKRTKNISDGEEHELRVRMKEEMRKEFSEGNVFGYNKKETEEFFNGLNEWQFFEVDDVGGGEKDQDMSVWDMSEWDMVDSQISIFDP